MTQTAYERLLDALAAAGSRVVQRGDAQASAQCPAHEDKDPSLSVTKSETRVLVKCHAGCSVDDVLDALKLARRDLFDEPREQRAGYAVEAEYPYVDEHGEVLYTKERRWPKAFMQYRDTPQGRQYSLNGVRRVLYRLPDVVAALAEGCTVYLCEGEKDADALAAAGVTATTWTEGAWRQGEKAKWRRDYTAALAGAQVVIVADADDVGRNTAKDIARQLDGTAASVRIVLPADGKDASDHLAAGLPVTALRPLAPTDDAKSGKAEPRRELRLTPASTIKVRRTDWLWEGRIPVGQLTFIPGRAGIGKSTLLCWLVARVTRGELDGVHYGLPRGAVYAASEDSWERTIVPRLIAAGADLERVYRLDVEVIEDDDEGSRSVRPVSLPLDLRALAEAVVRHDIALLAMDPFMSSIGDGIDTHSNRELRAALEPVARMADQTNISVVGLAHFRKSAGSDPLTAITGSSAFGEVIRAAIGIARDPNADDGSVVLSQIKNNLGREDVPSLRYQVVSVDVPTDDSGVARVGRVHMLGESEVSVSDILSDASSGLRTDREAAGDAEAWLIEHLEKNGGESPRQDVLAAAGKARHSEDAIRRAFTKLRKPGLVSSHRDGFQGPFIWSLNLPALTQRRHDEVSDNPRQPAQPCTATPAGQAQPAQPAQPAYVRQEPAQVGFDEGQSAQPLETPTQVAQVAQVGSEQGKLLRMPAQVDTQLAAGCVCPNGTHGYHRDDCPSPFPRAAGHH